MKRRGGGAIVNLASIMGLSGGIYPNASYQASKGGGGQPHARAGARMGAGQHPRQRGRADLRAHRPHRAHLLESGSAEDRDGAHAAGRFPEPEDIAAGDLFPCSDAARCITGVTLPVDSGYLALASPRTNRSSFFVGLIALGASGACHQGIACTGRIL